MSRFILGMRISCRGWRYAGCPHLLNSWIRTLLLVNIHAN